MVDFKVIWRFFRRLFVSECKSFMDRLEKCGSSVICDDGEGRVISGVVTHVFKDRRENIACVQDYKTGRMSYWPIRQVTLCGESQREILIMRGNRRTEALKQTMGDLDDMG